MDKYSVQYGKTDCAPADVGYDESRIEALHKHFQRLIDEKKIIGASYAVSRYGKTFMHGGIGKAHYREDANRPMMPDSVTGIASITKTFTAIAIMRLVEDGLIRLDDQVQNYIPAFKSNGFYKIDIYSLLTHTSGLYPDCEQWANELHVSYWDFVQNYFEKYKPEDGELDWIKAALGCGAKYPVGKEWQYCSFGFVILGVIIEKVTGMKASDYIENFITKPLGMKDSQFSLTDSMRERFIIRTEHDEENSKQNDDKISKMWDEHVPPTGGGLKSTPQDLLIYANTLLNGGTSKDGVRIIGRKSLEKLTTRALYNIPDHCWNAENPDRSYGIGFDMRTDVGFTYSPTTYHHEGAGACALFIDPTEQLAAAWLVPFADDGWYAEAVHNTQNIIWSGLK